MVLKPVFELIKNNDIVPQSSLISLTLKDEIGFLSDELTVKISKNHQPPIFNDRYTLSIGYNDKLNDFGSFSVQTIEEDVFYYTVKATGIDYNSTLKEKKNRSFENILLSDLIDKIAGSHGLMNKCDFNDIFFVHISQTFESDLNFLSRLAEKYNAIFNIKNDVLVFLKQNLYADTYSSALPVFEFNTSDLEGYRIKNLAKVHYKSCAAHYWDTVENREKVIVEGAGSPQFILSGAFTSPAEAKRSAYHKLLSLQKKTIQGSLTAVGQEIFAGGVLILKDDTTNPREFMINSVTHTLNESGWKITVNFHN